MLLQDTLAARCLRLTGIVCLACLLASCDAVDTMKDGFAHSKAVSSQLEKSLGVTSFVGFNWNNGVLTSVNVTFQGIPQNAALPDIIDKSKRAVEAEFKQMPRQIIVGFSVQP